MLFTSVPGIPGGFKFRLKSGICTGHSWIGFGPPSVDHFNVFVATATGNALRLCLGSDKAHVDNIDELFGLIEDKFDGFINGGIKLEGKL
jgi:hypothetical protein